VIAATEKELAGAGGSATLVCGIGPDAAYMATEDAVAEGGATAVLHIGIAGARRGSGVALLATVIGSEAIDCDGDSEPIAPDARLLAAAQRALPDAVALPIGTSARVGGTKECEVEAMEGFAVLRAAAIADIPAIEVRVISNDIEESDRSRWRFELAFETIAAITPPLVSELLRCVS
jgi:nucleoside phosphorylase